MFARPGGRSIRRTLEKQHLRGHHAQRQFHTGQADAGAVLWRMSTSGSAYARSFLMHRNALVSVLERVPADQADFKAWQEGMSFMRLTDHLSGSVLRMNAMLQGQTPEKIEPSGDWNAALERMKSSTTHATALLEGLSEETLGRVIPIFGTQMPISGMIEFLISHETHHKGQIWMMARMIGLEPPMFVKMG